MTTKRSLLALAVTGLLAVACAQDDGASQLGPLDGSDLPSADLERVSVGDAAPDFRLASLGGEAVRLSDFRGRQNVVLVFYRGHW